MISIVYGVPGSGKSYYAVWFIRKTALEEGDIFLRVRSDVILITNLKLNLDSMDNYIYMEEWEGW
jgi:zona occludens toxin (predicted ATPase)